jgi:tRNA(Ile)-lysidine synthase
VNAAPATFCGEQLLASLARLPTPEKYWIGFSGGADSTALLQAMHERRHELPAPIHALHFHHGLQSEADAWQEHCRSFCAAREIPYLTERLDIDRSSRHSPEEAARNSRYRAVARILGGQEMYLTAHHAEDLAETLFLNLIRGSGIEGLAGIPVLRTLDHGWVARPLLEKHRADLEAFLRTRDIGWLDDPSNADTAFDRNYLLPAARVVSDTGTTLAGHGAAPVANGPQRADFGRRHGNVHRKPVRRPDSGPVQDAGPQAAGTRPGDADADPAPVAAPA